MNVLILANSGGGLYSFRRELITELLKKHKVSISAPYVEALDLLVQEGCSIIDTSIDRRGVNPIKDFGLFLRYVKIIREEQPELVITYTIKPNVYGGMACRILNVPYAVNITGLGTAFQKPGILRSMVKTLYRVGTRKAKIMFFENVENQHIFINGKLVDAKRTCLLNGAGVNLEHFELLKYPEEKDEARFLFIGRVMQEKGIDELFFAVQQLNKEGYKCSLDVLGGFEENYSQRMREYEQAGWLRYHGFQKDVRPFIAQSHCFVLPSWHEGMANTNLECAASGRPVITSDIHGCKEAVVDGVSGLLCQSKDAQSLYETMKRFLHLSYDQKCQMGKAGRKHMENMFDKKDVVRKTIDELGI